MLYRSGARVGAERRRREYHKFGARHIRVDVDAPRRAGISGGPRHIQPGGRGHVQQRHI